MTPQRAAEILAFWRKMPGNTCFIDALRRIAKGIPAEFRYLQQPSNNHARPCKILFSAMALAYAGVIIALIL